MDVNDFFGEVISTYTIEDALRDGVLMRNPVRDSFSECSLLTSSLYGRLEGIARDTNARGEALFSVSDLIDGLMVAGQATYASGAYRNGHDKDFFAVPLDDGVDAWFVRNEEGKLTVMLPEDY